MSQALYFAHGSRLAQADKGLLKLEDYMVGRVNDERLALGLPLLAKHSLLAAVARAHSGEMRDLSYFAHKSPTPHLETITHRYLLAFGNRPRYLAENISCSLNKGDNSIEDFLERTVRDWIRKPVRLSSADIEDSHQDLMNSPGHRANILAPEPIYVGIGIVSIDRNAWITQMFSRP